jgi:predicted DNA binding CopG/RHH family protein
MPPRKKKLVIPRFRSEQEELRFWDTHDWEDYDDGPATEIILDLKPTPKTRVTMWLDTHVVEALKRIAGRHEIGYQTLARELLAIGVERLEQAQTGGNRRRRPASPAKPRPSSAKHRPARKPREEAK